MADTQAGTQTVAVLGTGGMGSAMARRLLDQGHRVVVWDRTRDKAAALQDAGAQVADDPAAAVQGVDVALTMLRDGDAVREVAGQFLAALPEGAVWVQASTVGVEAAEALRAAADEAGRRVLDAPVSGSTAPAEQGTLAWLVSGPLDAVEQARPALEALGSVRVVGEAQEGSRLKLAVNAWLTTVTVAFAESLVVCDRLGVDRSVFTDTLAAGPLGMPYLEQKAALVARGEYPAGFPADLALKDVELSRAAGATGLGTLDHVVEVFGRVLDADRGREDLMVVAEVVDPQD